MAFRPASTRTLPDIASTCGVSKSTASREAAEAGELALKELLARRFDGIDLLVIYRTGMQFREHHVISAVGVDRAGHKHVLGRQQGTTKTACSADKCLGTRRIPSLGELLREAGAWEPGTGK